MKPIISSLKSPGREVSVITLLFCFLNLWIVLLLQSCEQPKSAEYQLITGDAVVSTNRYSTQLIFPGQKDARVLALPGELLMANSINFFYFPGERGLHLGVEKNDVKLVVESDSVFLDSNESDVFLLMESQLQTKGTVKSLTLTTDSLSQEQMHLVKFVSKLFPEAGLSIDLSCEYAKDVLSLFNPKWLIVGEIRDFDLKQLENLSKTEILYLGIADSVISQSLPRMDALKSVYLDANCPTSIPEQFLSNNPQIEQVWFGLQPCNFACLSGVKKLKKLTISAEGNDVGNLNILTEFPELERFEICADSIADNRGLFQLAQLRQLVVGAPIASSDFERLLKQNPALQMLSFYNHSDQRSLRELRDLKNLEVLLFTDTIYDREVIEELTQLKLLGVPESLANDSVFQQELQAKLPNCQIAINYGFCMGTGWLLAFFPLVLLFVVLVKFKKMRHG